ncbi:hypothetical protein F5877DRAFT_84838 [Lentinula edodes]|nr:hypothetical protein F5877DRAFT_84838 [Lentinula edodes]
MPPKRKAAELEEAAAGTTTRKSKSANTKTKKGPDTGNRRTGKKAKMNMVTVDDSSEGEDELAEAPKGRMKQIRVRWTEDMTDTLLTELTDNPQIKQGLFPGPGTVGLDEDGHIVTKSNTLMKVDYQFMLAEAVFSRENFGFSERFKSDKKTSKGRSWWAGKIKSKLEDLVDKWKQCKKMMGETGAGLTSEEQIDLTKEKFSDHSMVKRMLPQYFTLVQIIGQRPNIEPIGLGNGENGVVDGIESILALGNSKSFSDLSSDLEEEKFETLSKEVDNVDDELNSDSEGQNDEDQSKGKQHISANNNDSNKITAKQARGPKPNKSVKAEKPAPCKGSSMFDKFSEISQEEERTKQRRLDLRQKQVEAEKALQLEKIRVQGQTKVKRDRVRAEFELKKMQMQYEHQYRMASWLGGHSADYANNSHIGASGYHSNTPIDNSHLSGFSSHIDGLHSSTSSHQHDSIHGTSLFDGHDPFPSSIL